MITRADGSPLVTSVWFLFDGDGVVFSTEKDGVKGRDLARDGRTSVRLRAATGPHRLIPLAG